MLLDGLLEAVRLLLTGDEDTWSITALTLRVSLTATAVALLLGVPLGTALALGRFPGRRVLLAAANTGMGLPPVVVGLFVTVLLWRSGPLGAFGLLYTPTAMVIAQARDRHPDRRRADGRGAPAGRPGLPAADARAGRDPDAGDCGRCSPRPGCRCSRPAWPDSARS